MLPTSAGLALSFLLLSATVFGEDPAAGRVPHGPYAYHVDRSVFIPMRDGVRLATDIYYPEGAQSSRLPVVLIRTPYGNFPGQNFNDAAIDVFASHGFVVAVQDKRGKYRS